MDDQDLVPIPLTASEHDVLLAGLGEWGGPAHCTQELAVAMGFSSVPNLLAQTRRLRDALREGDSLAPADWARALIATEIVFASDIFGSGVEWSTTTGLQDDMTISVLRSLQRKLLAELAGRPGFSLSRRGPHNALWSPRTARTDEVLAFISVLDAARLYHEVTSVRAQAVMVRVYVPGQIWEVEFLDDGTIDVEKFASDGTIYDRNAIDDLVREFGEPPPPE